MDMTGEEKIPAPRQAVWAALNDVETLKQCIPGCQSLEKLSDTEMTAKVKVGIGPVRATFTGKVMLSDLDPPNGYQLTGEGSGGLAGHAKGGATVHLSDDGVDTLMRYEAKAEVGVGWRNSAGVSSTPLPRSWPTNSSTSSPRSLEKKRTYRK
jgi:uncharacterized protein